jgi:hypothetical protein
MKKILKILLFIILISKKSFAADFEDLCKDGYAVILETNISGDFDGCDYDKRYKLDNGLIFECSTYHYTYHYHPSFYILQNIKYGGFKYIIDDEEYSGNLYK